MNEAVHTGVRPYKCKECQRLFARQDSLARHEKLHTKDANDYPSPSSTHSIKRPSSSLSISTSPNEFREASSQTFQSQPTPSHVSTFGDATPIMPSSTLPHMPLSADLDFDLMWPDSEDLFETLMAPDPTNPWQIPQINTHFSPAQSVFNFGTPTSIIDKASPMSSVCSGESHRAVHNVSEMVTNLSASVTAAIEASSITSVFLDECLHMFFIRFIPTFPVLHRATFVFKECTQPLLLNAMAIGSLYLGPKDSVAKGEALWRLAHVALTTSWEILITHRGSYDSCPGIQLVTTALLAQIYGSLSKNRAIRTTSQAFHALGFFWARQCALSDSQPYSLTNIPSLDASDEEKDRAWRVWAAKEIQQRALLGHYVVDGLISRMSGEAPSVRHAANQLGLPSSEAAFEARTADQWIAHMKYQETAPLSFRKIITSLFSPLGMCHTMNHDFSAFAIRVILEGLQSFLADCENDEMLIGVPTKVELRRALVQVYQGIKSNISISEPERLELFLRWHTICLDACKDSSVLCRAVCSRYGVPQHVCGGPESSKVEVDLVSWANTEDGRRALLHAIAIQEIVEQLPRGRAHVIHIPGSLFASATVYCVFSIAGQTMVNIPSHVDWPSVLSSGYDSSEAIPAASSNIAETRKYIRGEYAVILESQLAESKNLLYELNSMQKLFRCLSSQWGISYDMEPVIDQWIALCH
ncbi:hypothetical protein BKA61DRAFT_637435 [Leptodontidium sp. MPI-SDFR-AT-0119]|nr:hypothetical protein BKA61DRAFT_637435 [Leptodontidium sp. MPI-SDFR-AT-0119]